MHALSSLLQWHLESQLRGWFMPALQHYPGCPPKQAFSLTSSADVVPSAPCPGLCATKEIWRGWVVVTLTCAVLWSITQYSINLHHHRNLRKVGILVLSTGGPCNAGDPGSIPGLERSLAGGHGNPLQYSGLGNWVTDIFTFTLCIPISLIKSHPLNVSNLQNLLLLYFDLSNPHEWDLQIFVF